jgi:hypothetical protein
MEGRITQWPKDIKEAIRSGKWRDIYHNDQKISKGQSEAVIGGTDNTMIKSWLPRWYLLIIVLSVPPFTASDCPFDIFWSLCYMSLHLQLLIAPLISFGHCVICPSIYSFWLPLWYLLIIVLSVPPFTASDCPFEIVLSKGQSEAVNGGTDNTMTKR